MDKLERGPKQSLIAPFFLLINKPSATSPYRLINTSWLRWLGTLIICCPILFAHARTDTEVDAVTKLLKAGEYLMALGLLEDLKPVRPCDPNLLFLEARVYEIAGEIDRAITLYEIIIKLFPELPEPYNNLATLYATRGEIGKAESLLLLGLETHDTYRQLQRNLSMVYIARAADAYRKALSIESPSESIGAAPLTLQLLESKMLFHLDAEKILQTTNVCDQLGDHM